MKHLLRTSSLVAVLGLGCAAQDEAPDPTDPEADPAIPSEHELGVLEPADLADVPDGTEGWARIETPQGVELLPYVALGGQAIYQDDIVLGPIDKVDARLRGGALTSGGDRWTDNYVEFAFHSEFTGNARTTVRQALAELEAVTPIDFKEVPFGQHTGPWIEFRWGPDDAKYAGMSTAIGMMGCGEWHFSPHWGDSRTDCGQWIYFNKTKSQPTLDVTKHEVLHALGMWHEQSRNDRGTFIDYNPECVANSPDQFSKQSSSLDLGPYDYSSIMHYGSGSNCIGDPDKAGDPYLLGCSCLTTTKWVDLDGDGNKDRVTPSTDLTREDINTLWRGYNNSLGLNGAGDQLANAMVVADFDGDGYDDVAVGAPGNNTLGAGDSGAVFVYKATSANLVPWRLLVQSAIPDQDVAVGDQFGAALATGDLNGDGFADLVVGAPGEDVGSIADAGAVYIYYGGKGGLKFAGGCRRHQRGRRSVRSGARGGHADDLQRWSPGPRGGRPRRQELEPVRHREVRRGLSRPHRAVLDHRHREPHQADPPGVRLRARRRQLRSIDRDRQARWRWRGRARDRCAGPRRPRVRLPGPAPDQRQPRVDGDGGLPADHRCADHRRHRSLR